MIDVLKGNFQVKNNVTVEEDGEQPTSLSQELRTRALGSIGGSMVYVERTPAVWDGHEPYK